MTKGIDYVPSSATGTETYEVVQEFFTPSIACKITGLTAIVIQPTLTAGENTIVEYRIMRGMIKLAEIESPPIIPPEWSEENRDAFTIGANTSCCLIIQTQDIIVYPNEKLYCIKRNKQPYVCSPIAGLEISYEI